MISSYLYHFRSSLLIVITLFLTCCFFTTCKADISSQATKEYKVVGYYANWAMYRNPSFKPSMINPHLVTHINYAFAKLEPNGTISLFDSWADTEHRSDWNTEKPYWGNFRQLDDLKKQHPHLKTLISIGGWTLSDTFSPVTANPATRHTLVQSCLAFCDQYNFDGIDIDWEYPGFAEHNGHPEDKHHFTLFLSELYQAAKAHHPPLLVTIAAPAGPWHCQHIELSAIHTVVDWINLMCYDFHGAWGGSEDAITNHQSALFSTCQGNPALNVDSAIAYYLSQGVPAEKIVLGMPLYGRSYANCTSTPDGLFNAYSGAGKGTTAEAGLRFFSDIKKNLLSTYTRFWDSQSQVPYLYNSINKEFITYDDEESLMLKCQYIKQYDLGGAMVWELGLDVLPTWDAMNAINKALKP